MTRLDFQTAVEEILGVSRGALKDSDSRDTVEGWSSLADVQIAAFIASESGIEPDAELLEAETFGDLARVLDSKHAFRG
jgi:acyl carrier protein